MFFKVFLSNYYDVFKNTLTLGFYSFFAQLTSMVSIFLLINFYETSIAELYFLIITTSAIACGFAFFGLDKITLYERAEEENESKLLFLIIVSSIIYFCFLLIGFYKSMFFMVASYFLMFSIIYVSEILYTIKNKVSKIGFFKLFPNVIILFFFSTFHFFNDNYNFFITLFIIVNLINVMIIFFIILNFQKINLNIKIQFLKIKKRNALLIWFGDILNLINFYAPTYFLLVFFDSRELIIFNLILRFGFNPIQFIAYNLAKGIDLISVELADNKSEFIFKIKKYIKYSVLNSFAYIFVLSLFCNFFSEYFFKNFPEVKQYINILIPLFFTILLSSPLCNLLLINHDYKKILIQQIFVFFFTYLSLIIALYLNDIKFFYIYLCIGCSFINIFIFISLYKKYLKINF